MIVEMRTYTLHPGKVPEYLKLYEAQGLAVQTRVLGNLIGYFFTEIGPLNQVVHLWGYADFAERSARRAELAKEPQWQAYLEEMFKLLVSMETKILNPTSFSPLR
jgi:hypothetical protein